MTNRSLMFAAGALVVACGAKLETPPKSGVVGVTSAAYTESGTARFESSAGAAFATKKGQTLPASCTRATLDEGCSSLVCVLGEADADAPLAGTITMRVGERSLSLTPSTDHTYPSALDSSAPLWTGGEKLAVAATGGDVPAFDTELLAPFTATMNAPLLPANGAPLVVSRASGLPLSWAPLDADTVEVSISGGGAGNTRSVLSCGFAASRGAAIVPSSALAALPAGQISVAVSSRRARVVDSGDWAVEIHADADARTASGDRFAAVATLE